MQQNHFVIPGPRRDALVFLFIDEAQQFPRPFLKQLVEQCASSGIRLVMTFHTLGQMQDDWETLSMTQTRIIYGAPVGGRTEEHLQRLFGMHKEYPLNFGENIGSSYQTSVSHTSSSSGSSVSVSESVGDSRSFSIGFSERDAFAWNLNDTLALNYDRDRFVIQVSPGAELAHYGDKAIVCQRGGSHIGADSAGVLTGQSLLQVYAKPARNPPGGSSSSPRNPP